MELGLYRAIWLKRITPRKLSGAILSFSVFWFIVGRLWMKLIWLWRAAKLAKDCCASVLLRSMTQQS